MKSMTENIVAALAEGSVETVACSLGVSPALVRVVAEMKGLELCNACERWRRLESFQDADGEVFEACEDCR